MSSLMRVPTIRVAICEKIKAPGGGLILRYHLPIGFIRSFADWVKAIRPEAWMGRAQRLESERLSEAA